MRGTSDSDKVLNIFVAGLVDGRHCSSKANQVWPHKMIILDSFNNPRIKSVKGKIMCTQTENKVLSPKEKEEDIVK